jgi:two-component system chemotaxis sensor kinase CheA
MDLSEYLPMFLAEATEHLQELNLAVVRIEDVPDDKDTVDQIFRIAHSFKGSSATMGFEGIAALTHRMEDVLELLRQRTGGLSRDAIDVLLECLDALSAAVESIEATGSESIAPAVLIERLSGLIREDVPNEVDLVQDAMNPDVLAAMAAGRRVVQVVARLVDDVSMASVRAYMVIAALSDHGDVLGSAPAEDDLEGFDGLIVEAWVATEHEDATVQATVANVPDVASVDVREAEAAPVEPDGVLDLPLPVVADAPGRGSGGVKAAATVRVDAERLDQLMHMMGELVVHRTTMEALGAQANVPGLHQAMQDVTRSSQSLQAMVMQVRMIPVEAVFLRFPRLVRDLSNKLDKQVELKLVGQDTELDRTVVDALGDPLVHLVRNSLDHGLEPAADRAAAGKPPVGVLEISARHAGSNVLITVRDDGRGIDPAKVAQIAVARGIIAADAAESIDMQRAIELLFSSGFSTAEFTSDISGRGVGMDAVRTMIRELGGEVLMTSEPGVGTKSEIRLPLTLAIMPALVVEMGGASYAIPIDRVERILDLSEQTVRSMAGRKMLLLDDGTLPLCDGARAFGHEFAGAPEHAVIVRGADRRIAIGVAALIGQRELVTRPLPNEVGERAAVSGGAVLSNGDITLIVDCDALATEAGGMTLTSERGFVS